MWRGARKAVPAAGLLLALGAAPLMGTALFAADVPAPGAAAEMSTEVASRLNAILESIARDPAAAHTAMQALRAELQEDMTAYEELVTLQTSANLNTTLAKYPEAIADYEALLAMDILGEADRLNAANLAGQLYLQLQDWSQALEQLLAVNALQGGTNSETLFRIAFAHAQLGQAAAALPFMEDALAAAGAQAPADYIRNMAVLYVQTQDSARAIATYELLLQRFPEASDREQVQSNLAALHIKLGDKTRASAILEELISDFPQSLQLPVWRQSLDALNAG